MSWDVSIMRFSRQYKSLDDIPSDESPAHLGPRTAVHQAVCAAFPGTDWSDPGWGTWESEFGSIEFNLGNDEPARSMMLHVRAGEQVIPGIVGLCAQNGWQAIDCSVGGLLARRENPAEGLTAWRAYRDRMVAGGGRREAPMRKRRVRRPPKRWCQFWRQGGPPRSQTTGGEPCGSAPRSLERVVGATGLEPTRARLRFAPAASRWEPARVVRGDPCRRT